MANTSENSSLLRARPEGDRTAIDRLVPSVYPELRVGAAEERRRPPSRSVSALPVHEKG